VRVRGLRASGDDYLTKPFAREEMVARAELLLHRKTPTGDAETRLQVGELAFDLLKHRASRRGEVLALQPTELKLLEYLMRHAGQVLTRTMIFEGVWGCRFDPGTNLIDVHLGRLGKKLSAAGEDPQIRTVRGSGYMLA
jgi:DNA-binding response OmpR family regulator